MDALTTLFTELLALARSLAPTEVCPGGWAWAVSVLGIGVGLTPAAGAFLIALLRKRIGSRYRFAESFTLIGTGLLTAGLLPLVSFVATGRVFAGEAFGASEVAGTSLESQVCVALFGSQGDYLGGGGVTVGDAFSTAEPVRFGYALLLLALAPLITSMFVAAQARLALRRGPSWPAKFFWMPILILTVLTSGVPYGTAGQLWAGAVVGSFVGIVVVLLVGPPSREVVRRSEAAREPRATAAAPPPARSRERRPSAPAEKPPERSRPARPDGPAERVAARKPTAADPAPSPALDRGPQVPVGPHARPTPTRVAAAPPFPTGPAVAGNRFRLVRRLGSGGFGRVWLAEDARLGHTVAVKAAHAPDAETEQRIRREARALAAVRHPHCVRIHDLVAAASDPGLAELQGMVIVMGYVEGSSLGELVRSRGLLDDLAAARVWTNVAGALDAAHRQGVLHRDVKPGNVVVDHGGLAHLIDFGIARTTGDATMTMAGFVLGTPDFLAPEVAIGERATPASDAWQLAATVSYALTGHPPRGLHLDAVSGLRAAASGAPLSHLPRRSAHLALLRAAMDNDPARRPPLPAVQGALEDWLRRAGSSAAGPVTAGVRAR